MLVICELLRCDWVPRSDLVPNGTSRARRRRCRAHVARGQSGGGTAFTACAGGQLDRRVAAGPLALEGMYVSLGLPRDLRASLDRHLTRPRGTSFEPRFRGRLTL